MKKLQQGFTLIELMIVVAIIGILAAIAVPAYQDYSIRSKVSEGASLVAAARTAIDVAFSDGTTLTSMPQTAASLGLPGNGNVTSFAGKYVSAVTLNGNGVITVSLRNDSSANGVALGTAKLTQFNYVPSSASGGNLKWYVCNAATPTPCVNTGITTLTPTKYLPKT